MHDYITRSVRLRAASLLLAGVLGGVAPVLASAAQAGPTGTAVPFRINGWLYGVAATSASSAWAVGTAGSGQAPDRALERHRLEQAPSPAPRAARRSSGVAATSASNAWAVGFSGAGKVLIERWNGTAWAQVPSPAPGAASFSAWPRPPPAAPGRSASPARRGPGKTLILRWNGRAW